MRAAVLLIAALAISALDARAQSMCGAFDLRWCDRSMAGADQVPGTGDDLPGCVSVPPGGSPCSQTASDWWTFGGLAECSDCPRTLFLALNCGESLWINVDRAQAMTLSVTDAIWGPLQLEAENECVARESGYPFLYCDGCAFGGQAMPKDDNFNDGTVWKNPGTCDTNLGMAPELPCLKWRASGTSITWGRPLDVDPGANVVFDADGDGFVDAVDPMPCTPCPVTDPSCPCGTTSQDQRATTGQYVRVKVSLPAGLPPEAHLIRIDMRAGGDDNFTVVANCDGSTSRGYMLHDTCAEAMTALATVPPLPALALDPDPSVALSVVDASLCPNTLTVAVTTCNSGSADAPSVPVTLYDDNGFGIGETLVDNAAHPTDAACQGPLLAGECRTCVWSVTASIPSMTTRVGARVDANDLVDECGDFDVRSGCSLGPESAWIPWCDSPACLALASLTSSSTSICAGALVTLDGSASSLLACTGTLELEYADDAGAALPGGAFPAPPTLDWTPPGPGSHPVHVNARCSTDPSCVDSASVVIDVAPAAFASTIVAAAAPPCGLHLEWTPSPSGSATYDVFRDAATPVPLDAAHRIASGLTVASWDEAPTAPGTFHYRVVANDSCGAFPNDGGDVPFTQPTPAFASVVTAVPEAECAVRVTWDASTATSVTYDLHRSDVLPVALDASTLIASGLMTTSYLDFPGGDVAQAYRVVAVEPCGSAPNDGGDSALAAANDFTPPTFAGVVDTRDLGFCEVEVSWDDATAIDSCSGIAGFNVYRDHGVGHRGETLVATLVPASPYVDTTPGNGTWIYVVRAVDGAGHEEQNEIFQQESENSCTNDFPGDAGQGGPDSPNADRFRGAPGTGRRELPAGPVGPAPTISASPWDDGRLRLHWTASSDEGGLYPVTYSVLRGDLLALRTTGYSHVMATPSSCGLTSHELILDDELDGRASYYLIVAVSGDNATFGYDSTGAELPAATVCE